MANDIYLCFECGTKNRVPATADRSRAKCAKCKANLFPAEASKTSSTTRSSSAPFRKHPPERGTGKAKLILGLITVGIIAAFFVSNYESDRRSPSRTAASPAKPPVPTKPIPPAVFQMPGIIFNKTGISGNHPFTIITSPGRDYFVKLVDSVTGVDKIGVFVSGGRRITVEVPAGQYRMRYASGNTWRGIQHLFGPGSMTSYHASKDVFIFNIRGNYYAGYTVELIRQAGGNMQTQAISASSF
ncbi:MAG: hypothetical protein P1U49_15805 [Minwuia sp.]|nr:hypothetical protein [Minwuia sp.]